MQLVVAKQILSLILIPVEKLQLFQHKQTLQKITN
jgi:hypothetical protein